VFENLDPLLLAPSATILLGGVSFLIKDSMGFSLKTVSADLSWFGVTLHLSYLFNSLELGQKISQNDFFGFALLFFCWALTLFLIKKSENQDSVSLPLKFLSYVIGGLSIYIELVWRLY
jgi:surface polysaccharide O-acyltransferase-like enzyme